MPAIWMHIEYGQRLAEEFRDRFSFLGELEAKRKLYQLGCQGPDFLLFHSFLPWKKNIGVNHLGNLIHSQHCGPMLIDFWRKTVALPDSEREEAQLYFFGFLTHHLLDRNLHPYINWKAGYKRRNHQRFEITLDTMLMSRLKQIDVSRSPSWKEIDIGPRLPLPIHTILHETALTWFPDIADLPFKCWQEAYRDMLLAHKCLYDPKGWKKSILPEQMRQLFYQSVTPAIEKLDYLNEKHTKWRHSALYSEVRTESVWELWDQTLEEGRLVMQALADWLDSDSPEVSARKLENFRQTLGDRSYDTGKECVSNLTNLFAEPIWDNTNTG